jgi:4-hydroxy-2-oxoheptanedioate aldolase
MAKVSHVPDKIRRRYSEMEGTERRVRREPAALRPWSSPRSTYRHSPSARDRRTVAVLDETGYAMILAALNGVIPTSTEKEPPMPATVRNVAREKLEQGQLSLGVGVRITRSVEIAKAMAVAGFDWLFLDMEHGVMSLEACAQISIAALDAGISPIARVPNGEYAIATRALDNGALGIVMPHVDSAAEAREVVNRLKYPPVGHRSMGGIGPHYGLRSASSGEAATALNAANLTIVMLETPTAIANAEEIAAVPGIDVLLIGTNDLCAEMGIHGDFGNDRVADAYQTIIAAARKHGKFPGMAGVYNETIMPRYIEMGARFILSGQDAAFMAAAAAQRTGFLRKLSPNH